LAASLALWTRRTLFDSGRAAAVAGHVVDDPAVIEAVSNRLTVEVLELVDAEALLAQALPPGLAPVAPLLVGAVANAVEQQVEAVLSSPSGQDLLVALVRRAHQAAVALLEGD